PPCFAAERGGVPTARAGRRHASCAMRSATVAKRDPNADDAPRTRAVHPRAHRVRFFARICRLCLTRCLRIPIALRSARVDERFAADGDHAQGIAQRIRRSTPLFAACRGQEECRMRHAGHSPRSLRTARQAPKAPQFRDALQRVSSPVRSRAERLALPSADSARRRGPTSVRWTSQTARCAPIAKEMTQ
ncbi:MAG: hypothetical protein K2X11_21525, partial [Acetobacteraceae bacterium]|nr:hypothetical protein [Acetobacteraceae bacterium]